MREKRTRTPVKWEWRVAFWVRYEGVIYGREGGELVDGDRSRVDPLPIGTFRSKKERGEPQKKRNRNRVSVMGDGLRDG